MTCFVLLLCFNGLAAEIPTTSPAAAASQPTSDQSPVATASGQTIHRWEIEPSAAEREKNKSSWKPEVYEKWIADEPGRRLFGKIAGPLIQKFIKDNHLQATPQDITEYNDGVARLMHIRSEGQKRRIKRIEQELSNPGLSEKERADLEQDRKTTQRSIQIDTKMSQKKHVPPEADKIVGFFIESWKFQRALYQKYGGRVIWQQAGIESLEGMQKWLEEQERAGAFEIPDPELRNGFYGYFHLRHTDVQEKDPFEKPWWLKEPDKEQVIRFGKRRVPPEPLPETAPSNGELK